MTVKTTTGIEETKRLDELAQSLSAQEFSEVILEGEKPKSLWVATVTGKISRLEGTKTLAIVMNADCAELASDVDYFITNVEPEKVSPQWLVMT